MAIDEKLAARVRAQLSGQLVEEKKMFGGLCAYSTDDGGLFHSKLGAYSNRGYRSVSDAGI
jgi:hypothetical protein